ncbi:hypothetical protein [Weissella cibaria]|uniref:hypothetical protein n=1 Tax=Weissella cibaria TaxID=137591 RepID=UPI003D36C410
MNDQGVVLLIWMISAVVGTFMMLSLYELGEHFIQRVWLKSWGPRIYFAGRSLVKGDVRVVRK